MTKARKVHRTKSKLHVFLVEDHPAVRRGLVLFLGREPDVEICGQSGGGPDALQQLIAREPDLAIVDLTLKEGDGLGLIKELRAHCPGLKIVVFSMHNQSSWVQAALRAGANGYVVKEEATERLLEVIRAVMGGKRFVASGILETLPKVSAQQARRSAGRPGSQQP